MKIAHWLLVAASVSALAACSQTPEPTPSAAAPTKPATIAKAPAAPSDITPSRLFTRNPLTIDPQLVKASLPASPADSLLPEEGTLSHSVHLSSLHTIAATEAVRTIPIDYTDGDSYIYLRPQRSNVQAALAAIEVYDPDGVRINLRTPHQPADGPAVDAVQMSAIPLAGHRPGVFTIKMGAAARAAATVVDVTMASSPLTLKLKAATAQHLLGNEQTVDAELSENGAPLTGARLTGFLVKPDGTKGAAVTFTAVGGGIYRTTLTNALGLDDATGGYRLDVRADGTNSAGLAFSRHGQAGFHYGIPTAQIANVGDTRAITDGSGNISAFEVDVTVDSRSLDRLELQGVLAAKGADGQEHPVAAAVVAAGYDAGQHVLTLRFDAGHVQLTRLEGDLVLRNVRLFSLGTNTTFHRVLFHPQTFAAISRAKLVPLATITPQVQGLLESGILHQD